MKFSKVLIVVMFCISHNALASLKEAADLVSGAARSGRELVGANPYVSAAAGVSALAGLGYLFFKGRNEPLPAPAVSNPQLGAVAVPFKERKKSLRGLEADVMGLIKKWEGKSAGILPRDYPQGTPKDVYERADAAFRFADSVMLKRNLDIEKMKHSSPADLSLVFNSEVPELEEQIVQFSTEKIDEELFFRLIDPRRRMWSGDDYTTWPDVSDEVRALVTAGAYIAANEIFPAVKQMHTDGTRGQRGMLW